MITQIPSINDILEEWKTDAKIDETKVDHEIIRTPNLHSKYLCYYMHFKRKLATADAKFNKMCWVKRKWFRGEMTRDELVDHGWPQYQGLKPSASELAQLLEFDSDVNDLKMIVAEYKMNVSCIEYIMGQIKGREWSMKSLIDYMKWTSGA